MSNFIESEWAQKLKDLKQEHVLKYYQELSVEERSKLQLEIQDIDWDKICEAYEEKVLRESGQCKIDDTLLEPLPASCIQGTTGYGLEKEQIEEYRSRGLTCIGQGKVAALLLAGGQGTRLGVSYPKGMYDVGLASHKSLFQLQAERILKLSEPLEMATGQRTQIIWYIMTSEATMQMTRDFFESHDYFGLDKDKIVLFEQNTLPCFGLDGKVLMESKSKLCRSPDGNGGLYEALHKRGIIEHMEANGVEFVHVYCVDNILVRVCDPTFMGYCISKQVEAGAKVVEKVAPKESVGVICKVAGQFKVIEYSELPAEVAERRDPASGRLVFKEGNICDHFFSVRFLANIKGDKRLPYHIARKKIGHLNLETGQRIVPSEPNGIKLEKFVFDVFGFTDKFAAWEVKREDEFSPLKNPEGSEKDNPTTALKALLRAYETGCLLV